MPTTNDEIQLTLPILHPGQIRVLAEARRYGVLLAGRRFGKSTLARHIVMHEALAGRPACWVAPQYKLLLPNWREVCDVLGPVIVSKSEEEKRVVIAGGGSVDFWSADGGEPAQGRSYSVICFDESALCGADLERLWTRSLRPCLADLEGTAWFLSTPKTANSYLTQLFNYGQPGGRPEWRSWRFGTADNPWIPAREIEAARADLPMKVFQQEFMGESISWAGSVFPNIEAALSDEPLPLELQGWSRARAISNPYGIPEVYVGCDWAGAGRSAGGDFTTFCVLAAEQDRYGMCSRQNRIATVVHLTRVRESFEAQRNRLAALIDRFRLAAVIAERNSIGDPQLESLRRSGLRISGFQMTNATKARIVENLGLAFENGRIRIPDIEHRAELLGELSAFEGTQLPNGLTRFASAPGGHDDLVVAMLLAYEAGFRPSGGPVARFIG